MKCPMPNQDCMPHNQVKLVQQSLLFRENLKNGSRNRRNPRNPNRRKDERNKHWRKQQHDRNNQSGKPNGGAPKK